MNKKSIALLLLASSVAGSVFASNFINKLKTKHGSAIRPSLIKTHKANHQTNHSYTDFTGTWSVKCGGSDMGSTVIENADDYITLDGQYFRIGKGLQGEAEANEEFVRYDNDSFEWNSDGSSLIMKGVGVNKEHIDSSPIETNISTLTLTMKNGQIFLDGKFFMFKDLKQDDFTTIHCTFTRKQ